MRIRIKTKYMREEEEVNLKWGRYASGELAATLWDAKGFPLAKVTVSAEPYGCPKIDHAYEIYVKDYGENEGMLQAMIDAKVILPTTVTRQMGNVVVHCCTLTSEAFSDARQQLDE